MENFYATIYNLKCARKFEEAFPAPRGEAKGSLIKVIYFCFILTKQLIFLVHDGLTTYLDHDYFDLVSYNCICPNQYDWKYYAT
jgi:hypothetical protein